MWMLLMGLAGTGSFAQAYEGPLAIETLSEANALFSELELRLLLEPLSSDQFDGLDTVFLPLAQHLDLNVIGAGQHTWLEPERIFAFVVDRLGRGETADTIGRELVSAYQRGELNGSPAAGSAPTQGRGVTVGGYVVMEAEYHQHPSGEFAQLLEVNQARLYFSADVTPDAPHSQVSFLGEWVPVPEEYIHQVTEVTLPSDATITRPEPMVIEVPFEQLQLNIHQVADLPIDLTFGQFRLPFGPWSDFTSHRNFSSTKANALVNGFALRKIELGAQATAQIRGVQGTIALVHGRLQSDLRRRDDVDNIKDVVGHLSWSGEAGSVGASTYVRQARSVVAAGIDWRVVAGPASLSGELVLQRNPHAEDTWGDIGTSELASRSGYVGANLELHPRWHLYGLYDLWTLRADDVRVSAPVAHVFHGLRYVPDSHVRWVVLEYGHMFHGSFDSGRVHLSSQLEVTF